MSSFLEGFMMVCFALSWPASIFKSWTSKSNNGKSLTFLLFILMGDIAGVTAKLLACQIGLFFVYCMNTTLVAVDVMLFLRNQRLERMGEKKR